MSDQGLWFKLWCSCLDDPDLSNLDITDFGRWAKLGAFVKRHGQAGEVVIRSPAKVCCALFQVPDFDALELGFMRLPNVLVRRETGTVAGETILIVSFRNWRKYQGDLSTQRVKKFREMKRSRGEEKRREEMRGEESNPPSVLRTGVPLQNGNGHWPERLHDVHTWLLQHEAPEELIDPAYWQRIDDWLGAEDSGVGYLDELAKFLAWRTALPKPQQPRQLKRAFRNWLAKSEFWSQQRAQTEARRPKFRR